MKSVTVSDADAKLFQIPGEPVAITDSQGNVICVVKPTWTKADIELAMARKAGAGRRIPSSQVLARLAKLEQT